MKHLVQLLLPVKDGLGNREHIMLTRQELVDRYKGVTAYVRSPAKGTWTGPDGGEEDDSVIMVEVLIDEFDRSWWRTYADTLATRFGEQEIHVRAIAAEVP